MTDDAPGETETKARPQSPPSGDGLERLRALRDPVESPDGGDDAEDELVFLTGPLRWWLPLGAGVFVALYVAAFLWDDGRGAEAGVTLLATAGGAVLLQYGRALGWRVLGYLLGLGGITWAATANPLAVLGYAGWTGIGAVAFPTWAAFVGLGAVGATGYVGARVLAGPVSGQAVAETLAVAWAVGVTHLGALFLVREIRARARLAMTDPLTGIANRRLLLWRLSEELAALERSGGTLALLYMDLDKFKRINEALGHRAGDRVLQQVAHILRRAVRSHDVVARVGGDEFVVLAPGLGDEGAERLAHRLQAEVARARVPLLRGLTAGWVVAPRDGRSVEALLELADASLFAHRRRPRHGGTSLSHDLEVALRLLPEGVRRLVRFLDSEDVELEVHLARVGHWSLELARRLGLGLPQQRVLVQAALVHDIGKIALPHRLLHSPDPLSAEDQARVAEHVVIGAALLRALGVEDAVVRVVEAHHERWDGTGYPRRLAGEAIPLEARILALADGYDALAGDDPAPPGTDVERELQREAGGRFDPGLVEAFLGILRALAGQRSPRPALGSSPPERRPEHAGDLPEGVDGVYQVKSAPS